MDMNQMNSLLGAPPSSQGTCQVQAESRTSQPAAAMPDMSNMFKDPSSVKQLGKMLDTMPDSVLEDMIQSQMGPATSGRSLPAFLTGARIKMLARAMIFLVTCWIYMKQFFAIIFSRNGKIIITVLVVVIGLFYQYGHLIFGKNDEDNDGPRIREGL
jgi:hypothetical protein